MIAFVYKHSYSKLNTTLRIYFIYSRKSPLTVVVVVITGTDLHTREWTHVAVEAAVVPILQSLVELGQGIDE